LDGGSGAAIQNKTTMLICIIQPQQIEYNNIKHGLPLSLNIKHSPPLPFSQARMLSIYIPVLLLHSKFVVTFTPLFIRTSCNM
jgi:hypothetical protein